MESVRFTQAAQTVRTLRVALALLVAFPASCNHVSALVAGLRALVPSTSSVQVRGDLRAWADLLEQAAEIGEVELTLIHARQDIQVDLELAVELRDALYQLRCAELGITHTTRGFAQVGA